MTIYRKFILTYILLAVVPAFLTSIYLISSIKSLTVERALNEAANSVEVVRSEFDRSLNMLIDVSSQIYLDKEYIHLIEARFGSTWDVVSSYISFSSFDNLRKIYGNSIENIRVFVRNDTILENWYLSKLTYADTDSDWYRQVAKHPSKIVWYPTINNGVFPEGKKCYSLIRLIETVNAHSVLLIDLNRDYLNESLSLNHFATTVFDANSNIIYTNDSDNAAHIAAEFSFDNYGYGDGINIVDTHDENGAYKVVLADMSVEGVNGRFRIASSFLLNSILNKANILFARYVLVNSLFILTTFMIMLFFSRGVNMRVSVLRNEMEQISKGAFGLVSTVTGSDEIGMLSKSLNVMSGNLQNLIEENYEADIQRKELLIKQNDIRLRLLINQINPHFLFNTLESLRMEASIRDENEISDTIERLGGLLRKSLHTSNDELPLDEEIRVVEDYLKIQAFRFGSRLQYSFSISDESKHLLILPFLIQPIVENAIIHGLEVDERAGTIHVSAYCEDNTLVLEVTDTGASITPEKLQEIRESLEAEETDSGHIGIRNVHLRIRLYYGEPYGLEFESGEKTRFTIRVPKVVKHVV